MPDHPLAEVFGFPVDNMTSRAKRYRDSRLCPFNNHVPNCTKDKADNPLGVCSIYDGDEVVITCPVRFRQEWAIAEDAAKFFFPKGIKWTSLTEVRLKDKEGKSAGNVDVVLVSYDEKGKVIDYGALEVQAVYISGNIRRPFEFYMENPAGHKDLNWKNQRNYPRADYLSSSRKRLAPQLIFKGGILHAWDKKIAVALNKGFYDTLPDLKEVAASDAEIAWLVYDLVYSRTQKQFVLKLHKTGYTKFESSLERITKSEPGQQAAFLRTLQDKLDATLKNGGEPKTQPVESPL